jgi:Purple acid Phosphatase, N-terminal domain
MSRRVPIALAGLALAAFSGCGLASARPARFIAHDRATVDGRIWSSHQNEPGGALIYYAYEWGKTTSYGQSQLRNFSMSEFVQDYDISTKITGLDPGTKYHWRICGSDDDNFGSPGCSPDQTFTTPTTTGPYLTLLSYCRFRNAPGVLDGLDVTGTGFPPAVFGLLGPPVGLEISRNGGAYEPAATVRADSSGDIDFSQRGYPSGTVDTFDARTFDDPNFNSTLDPGEQVLATGHLVDTCTP